MMFRKEVRAELERLRERTARQSEVESLKGDIRELRAEFNALVQSLGLSIKDVHAHKEVVKK